MEVNKIGTIKTDTQGFYIELDEPYRLGLTGLEGFSHLQVIWWADQLDTIELRQQVTTPKPYIPGPDVLGIFATRSPMRPNPICSTIITVSDLYLEKGLVRTWYIDGAPGTPVLDIKPYLGCADRPEDPHYPTWSAMLPETIEGSATFDWDSYFNF